MSEPMGNQIDWQALAKEQRPKAGARPPIVNNEDWEKFFQSQQGGQGLAGAMAAPVGGPGGAMSMPFVPPEVPVPQTNWMSTQAIGDLNPGMRGQLSAVPAEQRPALDKIFQADAQKRLNESYQRGEAETRTPGIRDLQSYIDIMGPGPEAKKQAWAAQQQDVASALRHMQEGEKSKSAIEAANIAARAHVKAAEIGAGAHVKATETQYGPGAETRKTWTDIYKSHIAAGLSPQEAAARADAAAGALEVRPGTGNEGKEPLGQAPLKALEWIKNSRELDKDKHPTGPIDLEKLADSIRGMKGPERVELTKQLQGLPDFQDLQKRAIEALGGHIHAGVGLNKEVGGWKITNPDTYDWFEMPLVPNNTLEGPGGVRLKLKHTISAGYGAGEHAKHAGNLAALIEAMRSGGK